MRLGSRLGDFWGALKKGLGDSNTKIVIAVLEVLATAVRAVGGDVNSSHTQIGSLLSLVMRLVGDSKAAVRMAAIACLDACVGRVSDGRMMSKLPRALSLDLACGRLEALAWCARLLESRVSVVLDVGGVEPLVPPLLDSLLHRSGEVRAQAERCLVMLYALGAGKCIDDGMRDLKPAALQTLGPMCEKAAQLAAASCARAPDDAPRRVGAGASRQVDGGGEMSDEAARPMEADVVQQQGPSPSAMRGGSRRASPAAASKSNVQGRRSMPDQSVGRVGQAPRASSPSQPLPCADSSTWRVPSVAAASPAGAAGAADATASSDAHLPWLFARTSTGWQGKRESAAAARLALSPSPSAKPLLQDTTSREIEASLVALQECLAKVAHPALLSLLFAKDWKRQHQGLGVLAAACDCDGKQGAGQAAAVLAGGDGDKARQILDHLDLMLLLCWLRLRGVQRSPLLVLGELPPGPRTYRARRVAHARLPPPACIRVSASASQRHVSSDGGCGVRGCGRAGARHARCLTCQGA